MSKSMQVSGQFFYSGCVARVSIGAVMAAVCVSLLAVDFAVAGNDKGTPPGPGKPINSKPISWEEMKRRCENPKSFPERQFAPENIVIQCTDQRLAWVVSSPGEVPLSSRRKITTAVFADKFHVGAQQREVPVFSKPGTCHRYKQVEETVTIERAISCAEILGMKGDLSEFCASATDAAKGSNPKIAEIIETGAAHDTCGGGPSQKDGKN